MIRIIFFLLLAIGVRKDEIIKAEGRGQMERNFQGY
jgi:hypothetical protein